jgi:hypothetical protein
MNTRKDKPNRSNYHYKAEKSSENEKQIKYFMTLKDVKEHFKVSADTIHRKMKKGQEPKKLKDWNIEKCSEPVYDLVYKKRQLV